MAIGFGFVFVSWVQRRGGMTMDNTVKGVEIDHVTDTNVVKLIEVLKQAPFEGKVLDEWWWEDKIAKIADHLIANGVTFATDNNVGHKWIPVTERLPDTQEYDWVLAQVAFIPGNLYGVPVVAELRHGEWYDAYDETIEGDFEKVTHWMPLPEPPKGD
jgi:hypothetical protein